MSLRQIKAQAKRLPKVLTEMGLVKDKIPLSVSQEIVSKQYGYSSFHAATESAGKSVPVSHGSKIELALSELDLKKIEVSAIKEFSIPLTEYHLENKDVVESFKKRHPDMADEFPSIKVRCFCLEFAPRKGVPSRVVFFLTENAYEDSLLSMAFINEDWLRRSLCMRAGFELIDLLSSPDYFCLITRDHANNNNRAFHFADARSDTGEDFKGLLSWEPLRESEEFQEIGLRVEQALLSGDRVPYQGILLLVDLCQRANQIRYNPDLSREMSLAHNPMVQPESLLKMLNAVYFSAKVCAQSRSFGFEVSIRDGHFLPFLEVYEEVIPELRNIRSAYKAPPGSSRNVKSFDYGSGKIVSLEKGVLGRRKTQEFWFSSDSGVLCPSGVSDFDVISELRSNFITRAVETEHRVVVFSRYFYSEDKAYSIKELLHLKTFLLEKGGHKNEMLEQAIQVAQSMLNERIVFVFEDMETLLCHEGFRRFLTLLSEIHFPFLSFALEADEVLRKYPEFFPFALLNELPQKEIKLKEGEYAFFDRERKTGNLWATIQF